MSYSNLLEKKELLKNGKIDLSDNFNSFKQSIEAKKNLNAFISVFDSPPGFDENAFTSALDSSKIAGAVISVKDILAIEPEKMTCCSKILSDYQSIYTATAVQKLLEAGVLINGKTNCDEFAMGSSNENSAFGAVLNPHDTERVPGGSSGGSAVAVAANLCDASLGTDTGGSIRQPAAFCGVYGLKPTYGRVSRYGLTAFASSFDCIGPFTKNVTDSAAIMEVISGKDEKDSTSADQPVPEYTEIMKQERKFKIALPKEYFSDGLDNEIKDRIFFLVDKLKNAGHEISEISLKHTEYSIATYYVLTTAEASSNLARFDGVRFGHRTSEANNLEELYTNSREEGFGPEVKRRIMLGTYVLSAGYYDAYYRKAQKVRRLIQNDFLEVFRDVDLLIAPTTPTPPFKIGEMTSDPLQMYLNDIYTTSANLAGIPSLNIPIGKNSQGLPIGCQIMGNHFEEGKIFDLAYQIENKITF